MVIPALILVLCIWLVSKGDPARAFLADQSKEALNLQITFCIAYAVCFMLCLVLIGFLLIPLLCVTNLVFCIIAGVKANEGVAYRYPFALRLIK